MVDAVTPQDNLSKASAYLDSLVDKALGRDANVSMNRGGTVRLWKEGASEDVIQITVKDDKFKNASVKLIEDEAAKITEALHQDRDIRREAVLLSPKKYLEYGRQEVKEIQELAKATGTPMANIDFSSASILEESFSPNQKQAHGTQVVDGPDVTRIRINIPTNPEKLKEAEAMAKAVEADITSRLPQVQSGMIEYIKRKKAIPNLTPEMEEQLKKHEFKVVTQQQENWTSVFIEIRSPEQVKKRDTPNEKILKADGQELTPEELKSTNMLIKIDDADRRAKVAARAALFTGEKLCTPASYFMDVAGVDDVKNGLKKMLKHAVEKNPELKQRAEDLLNENFFIAPQWNLPTEQQAIRKQPVAIEVKPGTDELKITLRVKENDGDKMLAALATKTAAPAKETAGAEIAKDTAAVAAGVAACPPGEIAIAGAGAGADAKGNAVAGAGGACLNPETNEIKATGALAAQTPEGQAAVAGGGSMTLDPAVAAAIEQATAASTGAAEKPAVTVGHTVIEPKQPAAITPKVAESFLDGLKTGKISLGGPTP